MRILVVSDSHGDTAQLKAVVERTADEIDLIIHCGDGEGDFEKIGRISLKPIFRVSGNCGASKAGIRPFLSLDFEGKRLFVCHGHTFGVHNNLTRLKLAAETGGFNIVLFGHTHTSYQKTVQGILFLNPGSISRPRGDPNPTYAILSWGETPLKAEIFTL